ncbi:MAG TPA: hypothetical protein VFG05_12095 [Methylocella sp.]|nr:hypothetical protein [Methylocella sp.]
MLSACGVRHGTFDTPEPATAKLSALLGKKPEDPPPPASGQSRHIFCPDFIILEGAAASRVYSADPPVAANLRHQFSITDTARECSLDGDKLSLKAGVAGKVLLGPAGSAGTFSVPVRISVLRKQDNEPLVTKIYRAAVTVPPGATQSDFTIVSEPLRVPFVQDHAEEDYTIKAGIEEGPAAEKAAGARP